MTYLDALLAGALEPAIAPRTLPADALAAVPFDTAEQTGDVTAGPDVAATAAVPPELEPTRPQPPTVVTRVEVVERAVAGSASPTPAPTRPDVDPPPRRAAAHEPRHGPPPVDGEARIEPLVVRERVPATEVPPVAARRDATEPRSESPQVPAGEPSVGPAARPLIEPRSVVQTPPPVAPPSSGGAVGESPPPHAPAINVRIGRIVVQSPPAPRRPAPGQPTAAQRPLADYLAERDQ